MPLNIMSIFEILLYFNVSRPMISRVMGRRYDIDFKGRLIDHLVRFSPECLSVNGKNQRKKWNSSYG